MYEQYRKDVLNQIHKRTKAIIQKNISLLDSLMKDNLQISLIGGQTLSKEV